MKTSQGALILGLLAALTLSCESVHFHQTLNSVNDLKKVNFGESVPKHSLLLLHWFASVINIDHHNTITTSFNLNTDFGSHHFGDRENMLDRLPPGSQYYTVGNLGMANNVPEYVRHAPDSEYEGRNQDRIIFSAEWQISGGYRISRVYLTQHIPASNNYDPEHTYQISTNLLRQIRQFSNGNPTALRNQFHSDISDSQMRNFRQTWGNNLIGLGLLLFIVIQKKYSRPVNRNNYTQKSVPKRVADSASKPMQVSSNSDNPKPVSKPKQVSLYRDKPKSVSIPMPSSSYSDPPRSVSIPMPSSSYSDPPRSVSIPIPSSSYSDNSGQSCGVKLFCALFVVVVILTIIIIIWHHHSL